MHPATPLTAARSALGFIGSALGYVAAPLVLSLFAAQPGVTAIRDTLWPLEPERRILVIAFAAPFLVAALVAVVLQVEIAPLWAISTMTLFPVVLLSSPQVTIPRPAAVRLTALAVVFPLVMIAVSPAVAVVIHRGGVANYQDDYQLVAQVVERAWAAQTNKPLRIVGSISSLVNGTAFYFADQPLTFDIGSPAQTPWVDDDRIRREGMAMVCPNYCTELMEIYAAHYHATKPEHVAVTRRYFGTRDTPAQFEIVIIPPRMQ
jgi:hypothetical protein